MMKYKGYVGIMQVDADAGLIQGRVLALRDVITFQGETVAEARQAFQDSVDDYLEWCAAEKRAPEKPYNGKLLIRVDPELHRGLAQLAESRDQSINTLAVEALSGLVGASGITAKTPRKAAGKAPPKPARRSGTPGLTDGSRKAK